MTVALLRAGLLALVVLVPLGEVVAQDIAPKEPVARSQPDGLAAYRRADGTLDWGRLTRAHALPVEAGRPQFGLDLFLREVAVVAKTRNRTRIEEFFDGLLTTDFYDRYGLFVAGSQIGQVAYTRYLQRFIKPQFISSVLKTNLVLAAGIALPQIMEGTFEAKTFKISLTSLGLSSAAVKAGVSGLSWVLPLKKAGDVGLLARMGFHAKRLAKAGGWIYTAAELAVILYVAEEIDTRVSAFLERRKARKRIVAAGRAFLAAVAGPVTKASLADAADRYHQAWIEYRNHLYRPLHVEEARFARRLGWLARRGKINANERQAVVDHVRNHPALRANIERRYGSLPAYAEHLTRRDEAKLAVELDAAGSSYNAARATLLAELYSGKQRPGSLFGELDPFDSLSDVASGSRGDPFALWSRRRAVARLDAALARVSPHRLQAYDDELEVLAASVRSLRGRGLDDLADLLDGRGAGVRRLKLADATLIQGVERAPGRSSRGLAGWLRRER